MIMTSRTYAHPRTAATVYIALFAVLIAVCSWISIPGIVPFTLQTFAIFCTVGLLGGKRGTVSVLVYILLGIIGIPVFAGFSGGIGALLGPTGGYIIGFVFLALVYWLITKLLGTKLLFTIIAMAVGLLTVYAFGTVWFMVVYSQKSGAVSLIATLGWCVFPFIIPDLIKMAISIFLVKRLSSHVQL
ncbi:biotin transporter BioY [Ethanoligenens harbinense]|uniref:Biotin transporter n=1 Tax=Ethanoligenens harbinense (strain DSM 18485 / JCM 12961 / CGMCC 1.5033 / YUAN-3) TaxID=663278 RepID=E6U9W1_ETHHY|nr:BioY protein [Ethanoligenens harbinense YUAN-3]